MEQMLLVVLAVNLHIRVEPPLVILRLVKVDTVDKLPLSALMEGTQNRAEGEERVLMEKMEVHQSLVLAVVLVF